MIIMHRLRNSLTLFLLRQPTRVTSNFKKIIETFLRIFLVQILFQEISLPQFLIISHNLPLCETVFLTHLQVVSQIFMTGIGIDQENLILDYLEEDWNSVIKNEQASINLSFQSFLGKIHFILDKHAPLKKVSKHKLKFEG